MFSYMKGTLAEVNAESVILEIQGIGYKIRISQLDYHQLPLVGEQVKLYTFLQVKEDGLNLFGFMSRDTKEVFTMLLGVSGVGPKGALGILSVLSPDDFRIAVSTQDSKAISKAPGIGARTAQRIIIDLKDKCKLEDVFFRDTPGVTVMNSDSGMNAAKAEAVEALAALGYSTAEASKAVLAVPGQDQMSVEDYLKQALKNMK